MTYFRNAPSSLKLAFLALILSAVYAGVSFWGMLKPDPVEASRTSSLPNVVTLQSPQYARVAAINPAVDRDPFSPNRTRPTNRYRLAGELDETAMAPTQRVPIRWIGVILDMSDSTQHRLSAALGTNQNAPVQMLKPGETLGDYTLMHVDIRGATFLTPARDMLFIPNPTYKGSR